MEIANLGLLIFKFGTLIIVANCYKLVQGFRVTCFINGLYNTKGCGTITDDI